MKTDAGNADNNETVFAWRLVPLKKCKNHAIWLQLQMMPALSHWPDRSKPFNYDDSEVVDFIFGICKTNRRHAVSLFNQAERLGIIRFDPETRMWRGSKISRASQNAAR